MGRATVTGGSGIRPSNSLDDKRLIRLTIISQDPKHCVRGYQASVLGTIDRLTFLHLPATLSNDHLDRCNKHYLSRGTVYTEAVDFRVRTKVIPIILTDLNSVLS